jgi:hypothetical protein
MARLTPPQIKDLEHPILEKGGLLTLKHPMPGVQIRFTIDGSAPDSLRSPMYQGPIPINRALRLRAIGTRPGWITSDTLDQTLFVRSLVPASARLLTKPDSNYKVNGINSLFDGLKGEMNNIRENWIAYHGQVCEIFASFPNPVSLTEVVVSTLKKTGPHILPPERIELWAGNDSLHMKQVNMIRPIQPQKYEADKIEPQILPVQGSYQFFKIRVIPVKALPRWHDSKGKKVWIFLDEVFFN